MRPLHAAAAAVVLLVVDFRTTSLDLLPDVLGWLLLGFVVHQVLGARWLTLPVAGGLLSMSTLLLPYHHIQIDPFTGERVIVGPGTDMGYAELLEYDRLEGARLVMAAGAVALAAIVLALLVAIVTRRAVARGAAVSARRLRIGVAATVLLWAVPRLIGMAAGAGDGYDPTWDDGAGRIALVGIAAALGLAVLLARDGREPWGLRPGTERTLASTRGRPSS